MRAANYDLTPKAENTLGTIHPLRQSQSPQNAPQPRQSQSSQEEEPPYIREGKCPRNPPHPGLRESSQGTILLLSRDGPSEEESHLPRRQRELPERGQTPSAEKAPTLKFSPCPSAHSEPPPQAEFRSRFKASEEQHPHRRGQSTHESLPGAESPHRGPAEQQESPAPSWRRRSTQGKVRPRAELTPKESVSHAEAEARRERNPRAEVMHPRKHPPHRA